jgi:hypothetical protein
MLPDAFKFRRKFASNAYRLQNIGHKIFAHCGLHKTATKSLQVFLCDNREKLRSNGFVYPYAGCPDVAKTGITTSHGN